MSTSRGYLPTAMTLKGEALPSEPCFCSTVDDRGPRQAVCINPRERARWARADETPDYFLFPFFGLSFKMSPSACDSQLHICSCSSPLLQVVS